MDNRVLTKAEKDDLAVALILLKDFKCGPILNYDVTMQIIELATELGIEEEFNKMLSKLPPMKIEERYPLNT